MEVGQDEWGRWFVLQVRSLFFLNMLVAPIMHQWLRLMAFVTFQAVTNYDSLASSLCTIGLIVWATNSAILPHWQWAYLLINIKKE